MNNNQAEEAELNKLRRELEQVRQELSDVEILLENITEHSTYVEAELEKKNELMRLYLVEVEQVTKAAAQVEAGTFIAESLDEVAHRPDELGQMARVFQKMAREVHWREQQLVQEVQKLKIEIDHVKKSRQVADLTENNHFQELQRKARQMRNRLNEKHE